MTAGVAAALCLAVVASARPAGDPPAAPLPPIIVSVGYPQDAGPRELVEGLIGVRKGQRLSRQAIQRSIQRLFATGRYADIVVRATDVEGGVALVFEIQLKRTLFRVSVEGASAVKGADILQASGLSEGAEYYPERLSQAERAVTALYSRRGYDQAHVEAQLEESELGLEVVLHVEEGAPTYLQAVSIGGGPGLPMNQLLPALGLQLGDVLNLDIVDAGIERVRELYRKAHFYRVNIDPPLVQRGDTGARLLLPIDAGPQFTLQFHGNLSYPGRLLAGTLGYNGSEPLDASVMQRLARRVEQFYRYRGFHDVHVSVHETDKPDRRQALLVFQVNEGRPLFVKEIAFRGNTVLSDSDLRSLVVDRIRALAPATSADVHSTEDPLEIEGRRDQVMALSEPEPDPATVFVEDAYLEAADLMVQAYRDRGYQNATVKLGGVQLDEQRSTATARFDIQEGPQTRISSIQIKNAPSGVDWVSKLGLSQGDVLKGNDLDSARAALAQALGTAGYVFAQVQAESRLSPDGARAELEFNVLPGPAVRVGKVIVQGLHRTDESFVRANLKFHENEPLDPETLYQSQRNLIALGYFEEVGVHLIAPDAQEPVKDVVVDLTEMPRLTYSHAYGYLSVDGPVGQFEASAINAFKETDVSARVKVSFVGWSFLAATGNPPLIDPSQVQFPNGLAGYADIALRHPVIYHWLDLIPGRVGWRVDVIGDRIFRPAYDFNRGASVWSLDWTLPPMSRSQEHHWWGPARLGVTTQFEPEYVVVEAPPSIQQILPTLTPADQLNLRFPIGKFALANFRATATLDMRDDPGNPHGGFVLTLPVEWTRSLYAEEQSAGSVYIASLKVSGAGTVYFSFGPKVVLSISGRGGYIFRNRTNPDSVTIAPKRFFLGGSATMRGFPEDGLVPQDQRNQYAQEVRDCQALANPVGCSPAANTLLAGYPVVSEGGEAYELLKTELHLPFVAGLDLRLFAEAGNLWLDPTKFQAFNVRYVGGTGVGLPTPIGPIALDLGFNIQAVVNAINPGSVPDVLLNEPLYNVNFSVGLF